MADDWQTDPQSDAWTQVKNRYGLNDSQVQKLIQNGYTDVNALMQGGEGSLPILLAKFAGSGQGGGTQASTPVTNLGNVDPSQMITNLGAAALGERASYAPVPGTDTSAKSGVSQATQGYLSSAVPNVQRGPWTQTPGVFVSATGAVTPGTQIAKPLKPGDQPIQQPDTYKGPTQMQLPSVFAPVQPTAPAQVTPAQQPTGMAYRPGQPWATAPTPGSMGIPGMTGGPPPPAPVSGGGGWTAGGGAMGMGGAALAGAQTALGTPVKRMQTGGIVTDPTLAMIGENGPEAVLPLSGLSNQDWTPQQRQLLAQMIRAVTASGNVNPNLQASLGSIPRTIARPQQSLTTPSPTPESDVVTGSQYGGPPPGPPPPPQRPPQMSPSQQNADWANRRANMSAAQDYANYANKQGISPAQQEADMSSWERSVQNQQRPAAVYDAQGNVVASNPNLIAQAAGGPGARMGAGGAVFDAQGNLVDSSANLTAQDVGGPGATMTGNPMAGGGGAAGGGNIASSIAGGIGAIGDIIGKGIAGSVGSWKIQPSAIPSPTSFTRNRPQVRLQDASVTNWNQLPEHIRPTDIYSS